MGMANAVDAATYAALENGSVTSASVLVPAPWFPEVARWARGHPNADIGVELDLNSDWSSYRWRPISPQEKGSGLVDSAGYFPPDETSVFRHARPDEVEKETTAQIDLAKQAGISITHLDTHMRAMTLSPPLFQIYWKLGQRHKLPLLMPNQRIRNRGIPTGQEDIYSFGGVDVNLLQFPVERLFEMMPGIAKQDWLNAYEKSLTGLPPGVYLLSVHLGYNDGELQAMTWDHPNWGAQWRQNDFDVVTNPEFQKFLKEQRFILVGWRDLQKAMPQQ